MAVTTDRRRLLRAEEAGRRAPRDPVWLYIGNLYLWRRTRRRIRARQEPGACDLAMLQAEYDGAIEEVMIPKVLSVSAI